ncbi:MAG TPA: Smr/MutS family protein [Cyclobacteriaceae bacterium]|nr:Smr/MutS family protein [Cyclobacteriaceae bacterium]
MIYPADFEARLGFDQIRQRITQYCVGSLGKRNVSAISFQTDPAIIRKFLFQNLEVRQLLDQGNDLPVYAYDDPDRWFEIAGIEGNFLESHDFLKIKNALDNIHLAQAFLDKNKESCPTLHQLTAGVGKNKRLHDAISKTIDDEGHVADRASVALGKIRKRLREEEQKIRRIADQIMRTVLEHGWTPAGSNPTIRDARLVIPILAEHKRKLKGYVIDESATGQTVYLEPGEVMEANNDLRDLELEERKEIIRILRELTSILREELPEIANGYEFLGWLDFNKAKARFSQDLSSAIPVIEDVPALRWKVARHPLLFFTLKGKRQLVPLDISFPDDKRFLLVSGPNAGGKSVCLKTVGIIQYMFQCGLLVPVREDSVMGIFSNIFLDIGDQQSIENDLSTYSSHLKNMNFFLRQSNSCTLVLIDELGAGTDPNFGGGIAEAVLRELVAKNVWGLATTHYYNLKVFASNFPGMRNGAMLFDTEHLSPLFKLEIGKPGSSFALEIARKTGLSDTTLRTAETIIGRELTGLETLMKTVADEKQRLDARIQEINHREQKLSSTLAHYDELVKKLESQKKEIINNAKAEASVLLKETNREIEKTIRHIRENKAEKQETRKVRQGLKDLERKVKPVSPIPVKIAGPLKEHDKVRMIGGEVTGTILSIKGKTAIVQFGELRSSVKTDKLVRSDEVPLQKSAKPITRGIELHRRQSNFSPVLDVRGKRVEELLPLLERFMDDAVLLNQAEVKILHGKGEGVLRKVVRDYLKGVRGVESVKDEHADRGGEGVTIVVLK